MASVLSPNPISSLAKPPVSPWLSPLLYFLGRRIVIPRFFSSIAITGVANVPRTGPVIIAPTHRSRWDGILIPYSIGYPTTGRHLRYMVSHNEMLGLQGYLIRQMGGFPVHNKNPSTSMFRLCNEILATQQTLVIFPEGDIFRDGQVHSIKPGLARIALQAETAHHLGTQIVPVSLNYNHPYPSWGARVKVTVGLPIAVAEYSQGPSKQAAQQLTNKLQLALKELDDLARIDPW